MYHIKQPWVGFALEWNEMVKGMFDLFEQEDLLDDVLDALKWLSISASRQNFITNFDGNDVHIHDVRHDKRIHPK